MKTKKTAILIGLFVVGVLFATTIATAYKGDYTTTGPEYTEERHDAMQTAFAELDYDTWAELMTSNGRTPRVVEVVNKENFEIFVAAHNAGVAGDTQTAQQLRESLGLRNGAGLQDGDGFKQGQHQGQGQQQRGKANMQQRQGCMN
jgi:hypothetical protein